MCGVYDPLLVCIDWYLMPNYDHYHTHKMFDLLCICESNICVCYCTHLDKYMFLQNGSFYFLFFLISINFIKKNIMRPYVHKKYTQDQSKLPQEEIQMNP
jgi:hypothetical protein